MDKPVLTAFAACLALLSLAASAQKIYRWTDRDGRVHYSEQPPADAKALKSVRRGDPPPESTPSPELQAALKNHPVTLYQAVECERPCKEARDLLSKRGVPYRVVDVDGKEKLEELQKRTGSGAVPALVVGSVVNKGFEAQQWNEALDGAGYPKSAPPAAGREARAPN